MQLRITRRWRTATVALAMVAGYGVCLAPSAHAAATGPYVPVAGKANALDCNGNSPMYPTIRPGLACSDIKGINGVDNANTWGGHFYDNGTYIGHDEPDLGFISNRAGSGNQVTWNEKLPSDPAALPTVSTPGKDVTHTFELTIAPWFSMALCNGQSYPQLPCTPQSDKNAPKCFGPKCPSNTYPGAGSSFLEMQFYPPGDAPFVDSISCDNTHWCASLHINDLECTFNFATCNPACEEPTNFSFVQTNGVPTGPPSPQLANNSSYTPDANTLLMNPADKLVVKIGDAPAPGGGHALEVSIRDVTTGQSGFMQASAANGFAQTSMTNCSGTPFNYEPEYSSAKAANVIPWAALQTNISTEFEIGHFEPCTSVSNVVFNGAGGAGDPVYNTCAGPYEPAADNPSIEPGDAPCFTLGDTHGTLASPPNEVAGCLDAIFQNGDLDFDGSGYYKDWPTGTTPTSFPSTIQQSPPTSSGHAYPQYRIQTDVALSESTCTSSKPKGCAVPPVNAPGAFYPYWSMAKSHGKCTIEFGNVSQGVTSFGKDAQYGKNRTLQLGYPEFEGPIKHNGCAP